MPSDRVPQDQYRLTLDSVLAPLELHGIRYQYHKKRTTLTTLQLLG